MWDKKKLCLSLNRDSSWNSGTKIIGDKDALSELKAVVSRIDHLPYWVSGGTALGLVRDGRIFPWDSDIDVCLLADWNNPPGSKSLDEIFTDLGYVWLRRTNYDNKPSQRAYWHEEKQLCVDVYYCYEGYESGYIWMFCEEASIRKPMDLIKNRRLVRTEAGSFVMPHPVEDYLTERYGEDWRKPVKDGWKSSVGRARISA